MKNCVVGRLNASAIKNFLNTNGELFDGLKGTRALYQRYSDNREILVFEVEDGKNNNKCFIFEYDHGNLRSMCTQYGAMEVYLPLVCTTEAMEYIVW